MNNAYWHISVLSVQWDYGMLDYDYCYNKHKTVKIWRKHCYTSLKENLINAPLDNELSFQKAPIL